MIPPQKRLKVTYSTSKIRACRLRVGFGGAFCYGAIFVNASGHCYLFF